MVFKFLSMAVASGITKILSAQFEMWLPWITERIFLFSICQLPYELRNRFEEEWYADLSEVSGKLRKLLEALRLTCAAYRILLQGRGDSEHEQSLIRIGFAVLILACLLLAPLAGSSVPIRATLAGVIYLAIALLLLVAILLWPKVMPRRRCAGLVLDHLMLSIGVAPRGVV